MVEDPVHAEVDQTGQYRLGSLAEQKFFQIVVAERRELNVDLTDNADLGLGIEVLQLDLGKPLDDERHQRAHLAVAEDFLLGEVRGDLADQLIHRAVGVALVHDIRTALVVQHHDQVAEQGAVADLDNHRHGQLKARVGVFLQTGEVERDDRNIVISQLEQGFSQQMDVVGRTASAAGLRQHECDLVRIIRAGLQRIDQLSDDEQRRIAGVVVDILQSGLRDLWSLGLENLHVIAEIPHECQNQLDLNRKHIRDQNGVVFFHLFRERNVWNFTAFWHGCVSPLLQRSYCGFESWRRQGC